ncbi:cytochrome P450 oxidoreductase [Mycena epipterygia]|nr:cytochrome P450 oxidoreductase [Mycena epipterygia]
MAAFCTVLQPLFKPAIIFGIAGLSILTYVLYNMFFHPLAELPGPIEARTGLLSWKSRRAVKLDMGWKLLELHERYGKVVRIARNEASICDPTAIEKIYRFKSPLEKTHFYECLRGLDGPTSISTVNNKKHAEIRRTESPAYAAKNIVAFEQHVDSCCNDLVAQLDRSINAGKGTVDLSQIIQLFAIDVVGELALGKSFGFCATGRDDHNVLPMLVKFLEIACLGAFSTETPWDQPDDNSSCFSRNPPYLASCFQPILTGIVKVCIDSRFQEYKDQDTDSNHHDMLEKFMQAQNPDGSDYDLSQIKAAARTTLLYYNILKTHQTMRAMIRFVVGDPRIYQKLQEEIDDSVKKRNIAFPLSYSDACKLPYFQACLKETLRLHPPVPWTLSRSVGPGGATIADHFFSEGTEVSMSPFVVHRRPEAYGDDAAIFRPERWTEGDPEQHKRMEHNNFAFGSGPRVCMGKAIGMMEISKVMPLLFARYSIAFAPRSATSPHRHRVGRAVDGRVSVEEPYFVTSQWVALQRDFWCDLVRRSEPEV